MVRQDDPSGADNVVSFEGPKLQDAQSALAQIEAYWQTARRGRLVPARSEIDPSGLTGVLEHAFILERVSSGLARFRVAGSHLSSLVGVEVRGMPLSSFFAPESREPLSRLIAAVFDTPATAHIDLTSPAGFSRARLDGRMVLLPLRSDLGDITRVLGGLAMLGTIGRAPRRLQITGERRKGLTGYAGPEVSTTNAFVGPPSQPVQPTPDAETRFAPDIHGDNVHVLFPRRDG